MAIFEHFTAPPRPVLSASAHCKVIADYLRANPGRWTQGVNARRDDGGVVESRSPEASRWCALGLLERFIDQPVVRQQACELLSRAITPAGHRGLSPAAFNDSLRRSVADIIQMFEAAAILPDVSEFHRPFAQSPADEPVVYGFGESAFAKLFKQQVQVQVSEQKVLAPPPDWAQLAIQSAALEEKQKAFVPWAKIMQQIRDSIAA